MQTIDLDDFLNIETIGISGYIPIMRINYPNDNIWFFGQYRNATFSNDLNTVVLCKTSIYNSSQPKLAITSENFQTIESFSIPIQSLPNKMKNLEDGEIVNFLGQQRKVEFSEDKFYLTV